jgi:hypothetical protein
MTRFSDGISIAIGRPGNNMGCPSKPATASLTGCSGTQCVRLWGETEPQEPPLETGAAATCLLWPYGAFPDPLNSLLSG